MNKVVLVGRHTPTGMPEDIVVSRQENILWSLNRDECRAQFDALAKSLEAGEKILLQNVPGILSAVLVADARRGEERVEVGVIISVPGERKAGVVMRSPQFADAHGADAAEALIKHVNARAKVERDNDTLTVTVDPVPEFIFSHIEWF